jgi:hypothetical protein
LFAGFSPMNLGGFSWWLLADEVRDGDLEAPSLVTSLSGPLVDRLAMSGATWLRFRNDADDPSQVIGQHLRLLSILERLRTLLLNISVFLVSQRCG